MKYATIISALLFAGLASCSQPENSEAETTETNEAAATILDQVDQLNMKLAKAANELEDVTILDHHRMAQEEGVYTPPAIASLYSHAEINTRILAQSDPLVGLDLPFKFLCFSEADTTDAQLAFTSAAFIAKRHGLENQILVDFERKQTSVLSAFEPDRISASNLDSVTAGFGLIHIHSDFDFQTTIDKLKAIVNAQPDTRWFGEINYTKQAEDFGVSLAPTTLLLFGGPAPGAKAMVSTPKIGLDAFCQKLLVYQDQAGEVRVAYNDIVAFAKLYYQTSTKPQQLINERLMQTFTQAVKRANQE